MNNNTEKFEAMCVMARKLYAMVSGECKAESVDAISMQVVAIKKLRI